MDVVPAIDLLGGAAVRLLEGRYDRVTVYDPSPADLARRFREHARRLHVVDLEGARSGDTVQLGLVREIRKSFGAGVQVGGGIRSLEAAERYLDLGVDRVVLGTAAIETPDVLFAILEKFPGRVVVALDAKDGFVASRGWERVTSRRALDVAKDLGAKAPAAILYTDIARDGTQVGPNVEATRALAHGAPCPLLASGGVGKLEHLVALANVPNVEGAIVGRALYERAFTLEEAAFAVRGASA